LQVGGRVEVVSVGRSYRNRTRIPGEAAPDLGVPSLKLQSVAKRID